MGKRLKKMSLDDICDIAEVGMMFFAVVLICVAVIVTCVQNAKKDNRPIVSSDYVYVSEEESAYEAYLSKLAVIETIGTDKEEETFGYDFSELLGIVYHESGGDYKLAKMIATCIHNTQKKSGCTMNPIEVCEEYRYTYDMGYYNSDTLFACLEVFLDGELDEDVGNATLFYSPRYTNGTPTHESKTYVCSYYSKYGEIRFFEE